MNTSQIADTGTRIWNGRIYNQYPRALVVRPSASVFPSPSRRWSVAFLRIPQTAFSPPKNRSDCLPPCLSLSFCSDILFAIPPSLSTTNPLEPHVSVTFLPLGLPAFPPARFFGHPHYEQGEGRNTERERSASGCESHGTTAAAAGLTGIPVACRARSFTLCHPRSVRSLSRPSLSGSTSRLTSSPSPSFLIPFSHAEDTRRRGRLLE